MHRHRILIVDDHAETADAYAAVLQAADCEVACAANGEQALQSLWRDGDRCVVVLDLSMPVMDGYAFRELQLTNARLASIPVVVLTGAHGYDRKAASLGLQHVLRKPLDPDDLLPAVTRLCALAPSRAHDGSRGGRRTGQCDNARPSSQTAAGPRCDSASGRKTSGKVE